MRPAPGIPSTGRQFMLLVFFMLGGFVVAGLVQSLVILSGSTTASVTSVSVAGHELSLGMLKLIQSIFTITFFLLPAILFARFVYQERPLVHLGFRAPASILFYLLAVVTMLLSIPADLWLEQLNKALPMTQWMIDRQKAYDQQIMIFLSSSSAAGIFVNLLVMALLPAICEESCFRGALQPILIRSLRSPWWGIVATGFIFSACHLQFAGFFPRMGLGIVLGAIYWYSGSLWVSILTHFLFNALQVFLAAWYPQYASVDIHVPVLLGLSSLALVIALFLVMRRRSQAKYRSEPPEFQ